MRSLRFTVSFLLFALSFATTMGQQVPYGINYQAVARDVNGDEVVNKIIDVRFTIYSGAPGGEVVYQEIHDAITTSRFGVFSLVIGSGTQIAGSAASFSDIAWESDNHFLGVEIKFENDFVNMGTMQFLSVPYALYAGKSLEPGPEGPQGPPGDPATDDQKLSFDGQNLTIDGEGNTVNLSSLIQYLSLKGDTLSITGGNFVTFAKLDVDDADADPQNEIQDLRLENDSLRITLNPDGVKIALDDYKQDLTYDQLTQVLTISDGNQVDLSGLVNTDNQELSYNPVTHVLTILNGTNSIDLDDLKNDADANPSNEVISSMQIQGTELVVNEAGNEHRVDLSSNVVAFRARKNISDTGLNIGTDYDFIANNTVYNDGLGYNSSTGEFTAPYGGIYSFYIGFLANGSGGGRQLSMYLNGSWYETLEGDINSGRSFIRGLTMKLSQGDVVKIVFNTGLASESGTGTFSGFKVY